MKIAWPHDQSLLQFRMMLLLVTVWCCLPSYYCFGNPQLTFAVIKPGLRIDAHSVGEMIGKRKIPVLFVHAMAMIRQQVGVKPVEKRRQLKNRGEIGRAHV